jgi:hypothetical protein
VRVGLPTHMHGQSSQLGDSSSCETQFVFWTTVLTRPSPDTMALVEEARGRDSGRSEDIIILCNTTQSAMGSRGRGRIHVGDGGPEWRQRT